jgi:hypothetical protein
MEQPQQTCRVALGNARSLVIADRGFPRNVFVGTWDEFLFFDSDWITDGEFVRTVQSLLRGEDGTCACLLKLDSGTGVTDRVRQLFIDQETTPAAYQKLLDGEGPGDGWGYDIARYCCVSDKASWCVYCEQASDIGVAAFRDAESIAVHRSAIAEVHAVHVEEAIAGPLSYGFSERGMSPAWRTELVRQYGGRRP